jgi:hypothetical protein
VLKNYFFSWHIEGQWRGMDPRIRIHPKKSWIRNAAFYKSVTRIHNLLVVLTVWVLLPMFRIRNILVRIRILTKKYLWLTDPEAERINSKNVKYVSVLRIRDPVPFWPLDPESRFDFFSDPGSATLICLMIENVIFYALHFKSKGRIRLWLTDPDADPWDRKTSKIFNFLCLLCKVVRGVPGHEATDYGRGAGVYSCHHIVHTSPLINKIHIEFLNFLFSLCFYTQWPFIF